MAGRHYAQSGVTSSAPLWKWCPLTLWQVSTCDYIDRANIQEVYSQPKHDSYQYHLSSCMKCFYLGLRNIKGIWCNRSNQNVPLWTLDKKKHPKHVISTNRSKASLRYIFFKIEKNQKGSTLIGQSIPLCMKHPFKTKKHSKHLRRRMHSSHPFTHDASIQDNKIFKVLDTIRVLFCAWCVRSKYNIRNTWLYQSIFLFEMHSPKRKKIIQCGRCDQNIPFENMYHKA